VSASCQPSCIPKHSYMHNHASYMFMHLIKLLCYSYAFASSIPMLIFVKINHVNFKFLQLCQFQTSTVMSISNFYNCVNFKLQTVVSISNFYYRANFKLQLSCRLQTVLSNSSSCSHVSQIQVHSQIQFVSVNGQVTNLSLLSVKWLVRIQEQLAPVNLFSLLLSVK